MGCHRWNPGAVIATIGLITPSIIVILVIAGFLKAFRDNKYVKGAFYGLRPASTGLITAAGFSVVMISLVRLDAFRASGSILDLFNWRGLLLAAVIFLLTRVFKKLHPAVFIGASAVAGILFGFAGVSI